MEVEQDVYKPNEDSMSANTPKKILEVKNLSITFQQSDKKEIKAVDDLSFDLHENETIGIVGESGSGKSVTSLAIMQLLDKKKAKIIGDINYINAKDKSVALTKLDEKGINTIRGHRIAMIFQEPMTSLNPVHRCGKQVEEVIRLHLRLSKTEAKEKVLALFEKVKLPLPERIYNAYPHELSGGQKQRVMIAMALSCNPSILIADEPTTALDVTVQKTILDLLKELQKEFKMGIIFISHDLGVIAELADKVIVLYNSVLQEQGDTLSIFAHPKSAYTKGLLACRPSDQPKYYRLPVISDFIENQKDVLIRSEGKPDFLPQISDHTLLKVENLKTYFPINRGLFRKAQSFVKAIDDVSFEIKRGETMGLVGESGCGKTTLGRTILRLSNPTEGKVIYNGTNIFDLSNRDMRELRKDMQIIFQDPYSSLNPRIKIGRTLLEPMQVHGIGKDDTERKNKIFELLEKVNLKKEHFDRYPHEFSGGQRQRICIARALSMSPQFIVCDESVSALDVSVQGQVLNLLNDLKKEFGFTYIFISHDLSVVRYMSDRMIVMNKGKIEEMGDAESIYQNPQSEYTKALINAIPKGSIEMIKALKEQKSFLHQ
jgi:peptide/nickel transport system ATP-binding protein